MQGYRSIGAAVDLRFPVNAPLVLFGQNNCGKSNITKALELVLGGPWPGNHEPDDHEFFKRNTANPIAISVFADANDPIGGRYVELRWRHSHGAETYFKGFYPHGEEGWVRGDDRESCFCVVLEAERNLRYQLSYVSKFTYLSRLMQHFHKSLSQHEQTRTELENLFTQIKSAFQGIPEFAAFTGQLRAQLDDLVGGMRRIGLRSISRPTTP